MSNTWKGTDKIQKRGVVFDICVCVAVSLRAPVLVREELGGQFGVALQ